MTGRAILATGKLTSRQSQIKEAMLNQNKRLFQDENGQIKGWLAVTPPGLGKREFEGYSSLPALVFETQNSIPFEGTGQLMPCRSKWSSLRSEVDGRKTCRITGNGKETVKIGD